MGKTQSSSRHEVEIMTFKDIGYLLDIVRVRRSDFFDLVHKNF
jgi:hypothetical protein